jgi:hypothetical protein
MCQHEIIVLEEGRVMKCRFEISATQYALFVAVMGFFALVEKNQDLGTYRDKKRMLQMTIIRDYIAHIIHMAQK